MVIDHLKYALKHTARLQNMFKCSLMEKFE